MLLCIYDIACAAYLRVVKRRRLTVALPPFWLKVSLWFYEQVCITANWVLLCVVGLRVGAIAAEPAS